MYVLETRLVSGHVPVRTVCDESVHDLCRCRHETFTRYQFANAILMAKWKDLPWDALGNEEKSTARRMRKKNTWNQFKMLTFFALVHPTARGLCNILKSRSATARVLNQNHGLSPRVPHCPSKPGKKGGTTQTVRGLA